VNQTTITATAVGVNGATISSTAWKQTGGPATASIGSVTGTSTAVSNLIQGTYSFQFTATDNNNQTATTTVTVTVNPAATAPPATPPTVSAGADQEITLPANSVTLTGTAAGANGATIVSTTWAQTSGAGGDRLRGGTTLNATVSNLSQGTYTFQLTVTDNNGQTSSSTVTV